MTTLNDARKAMLHIDRVTGDGTTAIFVAQIKRELDTVRDFLNEQVAAEVLKNEKCEFAAACENSMANARKVIGDLQAKVR